MKRIVFGTGSLILTVVFIWAFSPRDNGVDEGDTSAGGAGYEGEPGDQAKRGFEGAPRSGEGRDPAERTGSRTEPVVGRTAQSAEAAAAREEYREETDAAKRIVKGADYVKRYAKSNPQGATEVFRGMMGDDLLAAAEVVTVPLGPGEGSVEEVRIRPDDYEAVADAFQRLAVDVPELSGEVLDGVMGTIGKDMVNRWLTTVADADPVVVTDFIRALPNDFQAHALWGVAEVWGTTHGYDYAVSNLTVIEDITRTESVGDLVVRAVDKPQWP